MAEGIGSCGEASGEVGKEPTSSPDQLHPKSPQSQQRPVDKLSSSLISPPKARSIIQALALDQVHASSRPHRYKKAYLDYRLSSCDTLHSTDVLGHHGCVNALAFSRGQQEFLATGGDDQRILVWKMSDLIQGRQGQPPITMTTKHRSNIFTIDFSCDNSYVFTGSEDAELIKHDFRTRQFVNSYEHLEAVYGVAAHPRSPEVVITASEDGCVYIIDTRLPRRELGSDMLLCEGMDSYQCVSINPTEPRLVAISSSRRGSMLYDTRNRKPVMKYQSTEHPVLREDGVSVCFNSTGTQLFSMYRRHAPTIHSLWEGRALYYFTDVHGAYRNSVTMKSGCFMGQDDEYVVSGSDDFRVYIWKIPPDSSTAPSATSTTPDGPPVVVSSSTLSKWQSEPHLIIPGHRSIVNQTRYSKVHRVLASSGVEKVVKLWSDFPLHGTNSSSHKSRDPPARQPYTSAELDRMMSSSSPVPPEDPTQEDKKVLALFDTLLEEDKEDDGGFLSMLLRPHGIEILTDSTDTDLDSMLELANVLSDSSALTSSEEEEEDSEEEEDDDNDEDLADVYGSNAGDWYSSSDEFEDTSFDLTNESSLDTSTESSDSSSSSEGGTGGEGSEGLSQEQREGAVNGMRNRERESGVVSTESGGGTEGGGGKEEGGEVEGVGGGKEDRGSVGGTVDGDTLASRGIRNGVQKGEREEGSEDRNKNSTSNCEKDIADGTMKLTEETGAASLAKGATSAVVRDVKKEGGEETEGGSVGHSNNEGVNRKRGRSSGDLVTNGATSTSSSDSSETDHVSSTDRHCPRLNGDDLRPLSTEDQNGVSTRNGSVLKGPAQKDTSASENSVSEMSRDRLACSTEDASPLPKAKSKRQKLMERRANEGDYSQYKREDFLKGKGL